jgi:hypothetical protein
MIIPDWIPEHYDQSSRFLRQAALLEEDGYGIKKKDASCLDAGNDV